MEVPDLSSAVVAKPLSPEERKDIEDNLTAAYLALVQGGPILQSGSDLREPAPDCRPALIASGDMFLAWAKENHAFDAKAEAPKTPLYVRWEDKLVTRTPESNAPIVVGRLPKDITDIQAKRAGSPDEAVGRVNLIAYPLPAYHAVAIVDVGCGNGIIMAWSSKPGRNVPVKTKAGSKVIVLDWDESARFHLGHRTKIIVGPLAEHAQVPHPVGGMH